jgi:hypothetical protein
MCRLLAELTNTNTAIMRETIKRLESRSGEPAVDIRLTSDIHAQIHITIRALGLDPQDTQPRELYAGLQNLAALHDSFIRRRFNLKAGVDTGNFPAEIKYIYNRLRFNKRSWGLRNSTIKRLLRENIPKQVLKALNYRTADSLIKREDAELLLFLAQKLEPKTWLLKFEKQLLTLNSADFEDKTFRVRDVTGSRYESVTTKLSDQFHTMIFSLPLTSSIFVFKPMSNYRGGMSLLGLCMAIKETTKNQFLHSQLKHHQLQGNFNQQLVDVFKQPSYKQATLAGQSFGWDIVHRHYGKNYIDDQPVSLKPHLHPDDLAYRRAEEVLFRAEPALSFWHETDYVGIKNEDKVISFNIIDVLINMVNKIPFDSRVSAHLQQAVWDELLLRYMHYPSVSKQVMSQFEPQASALTAITSLEFV